MLYFTTQITKKYCTAMCIVQCALCKGRGVSKWSQYFYIRWEFTKWLQYEYYVIHRGMPQQMISMTRGGMGGRGLWRNQDRKPCNCPDLVLLSWKLPGSSEGSNKDFPPLLFLIFQQGRSGTEFRRVCRSKLFADEKDGEEKRRNCAALCLTLTILQ